jgi:hypothetical protein
VILIYKYIRGQNKYNAADDRINVKRNAASYNQHEDNKTKKAAPHTLSEQHQTKQHSAYAAKNDLGAP